MKRATTPLCILASLSLGLLATSCGDSEDTGAREAADASHETPAASAEGDLQTPAARSTRDTGVDRVEVTVTPAADPSDTGATATLRGTVYIDGKPPKRRSVAMDHVRGCREYPEQETESILANEDGQLQNVFVYITNGIDRSTFSPVPEEPVVLEQEGCWFVPHVLTVRTGQRLVIRNLDETFHNVNARPAHGSNKAFNVTQRPGGDDIVKVFPRPEIAIPLACDIHPWMKAYVGVVEHDYHAISDELGAWTIEGLAAGEYLVESWHEKYQGKKAVVTVGAGETAEVTFRYAGRRTKRN